MSITWTLTGRGWAACLVRDDHTDAEVTASYITQAPDDLLEAVTSVVLRYGTSGGSSIATAKTYGFGFSSCQSLKSGAAGKRSTP
jgi:hypothetical protein